MSIQEQFVLDYFQLGARAWIEKYSGNIPDNMDANIFSKIILEKKLEKRFINYIKSRDRLVEDLPCFLVPSLEKLDKYDVLEWEDKGFYVYLGKDLPIEDAIKVKCENLILILILGYRNKSEPRRKEFTYDYFKLGAPEWIKKYKEKIPEIMSPSQFTLYISHYDLKQDFIDEHSWRLDHSMILCFLSPQKDGLYDVINVKDKGLTITAGKDLSLEDAINLKAELLFERLK